MGACPTPDDERSNQWMPNRTVATSCSQMLRTMRTCRRRRGRAGPCRWRSTARRRCPARQTPPAAAPGARCPPPAAAAPAAPGPRRSPAPRWKAERSRRYRKYFRNISSATMSCGQGGCGKCSQQRLHPQHLSAAVRQRHTKCNEHVGGVSMAWAQRRVVIRLSVPVYPQHLSPAARQRHAGEGKGNEDGSMALGGMRV